MVGGTPLLWTISHLADRNKWRVYLLYSSLYGGWWWETHWRVFNGTKISFLRASRHRNTQWCSGWGEVVLPSPGATTSAGLRRDVQSRAKCVRMHSLQGHLSMQIDSGWIHASTPSARFTTMQQSRGRWRRWRSRHVGPRVGIKHVSVPVFVSCGGVWNNSFASDTSKPADFYHCYLSYAQQGATAINKNVSKPNRLIWDKCFGY